MLAKQTPHLLEFAGWTNQCRGWQNPVKLILLLGTLFLLGCANPMEEELQAQRERIVADQNALFNEEAAAIKRHYDDYAQNAKAIADLYTLAQTPEEIAQVNALSDRLEQRETQWDQMQDKQERQRELEDFHQQLLDQLHDLQEQLDNR